MSGQYSIQIIEKDEVPVVFKAKRWKELYDALGRMRTDKVLKVTMPTKQEAERARSAVHNFKNTKLHRKQQFRCTINGQVLYVERTS